MDPGFALGTVASTEPQPIMGVGAQPLARSRGRALEYENFLSMFIVHTKERPKVMDK